MAKMTRMTAKTDSVWAVPRDDIEAARRFYRRRGARLTGDEKRVLLRLQRDPRALAAELEDWERQAARAPVAREPRSSGGEGGDLDPDAVRDELVTVRLGPAGRLA